MLDERALAVEHAASFAAFEAEEQLRRTTRLKLPALALELPPGMAATHTAPEELLGTRYEVAVLSDGMATRCELLSAPREADGATNASRRPGEARPSFKTARREWPITEQTRPNPLRGLDLSPPAVLCDESSLGIGHHDGRGPMKYASRGSAERSLESQRSDCRLKNAAHARAVERSRTADVHVRTAFAEFAGRSLIVRCSTTSPEELSDLDDLLKRLDDLRPL
jgi:hypothetical protein